MRGSSFTLYLDWSVANLNRAPRVRHPGDRSDDEGEEVRMELQASDPDREPLSYAAAGLPPGLSLDPATGLISGRLTHTASGDYSVGITVTDGHDPVTLELGWVVSEVNRAPELSSIGPRSADEGGSLEIGLSAADPDQGDALALSASGLPGVCTLTDNRDRTGTLDCRPGYKDSGEYAVTVTAQDNGAPALSMSVTKLWATL